MKRSYLVTAGLIMGLVLLYFWYNQPDAQTKKKLTPEQIQLSQTGSKCLDFGDRAVANDNPTIEFQRLERISKRATVINNCMQDNGYKVNPAWTKVAQVEASNDAQKNHISVDEALVNLSRKDMQVFTESKERPVYWIK